MRRLKVTAVKGYTSRKLDFISQNDPFIKFTMQGHDVQYTSTKEDEDIPEWNQTFQFTQQPYNNKLNLNVFDKDQLISQSIGSGQIDLGPYFASNQAASVYVRIFENGVPAGKVLLHITPENVSIPPPKILSNQDINYYKASKHYKYENDFQAQGNLLSQLIQQQMKSIGRLNQNQPITKNLSYQANLYNNSTFNPGNSRYNNTNYKHRTQPAQISHQYSQQKHFSQISNQSKMIYVNNHRPQTQFINERTINSRQIVNQSDYYQNKNQIYQYPINQIRTPVRIAYQQSAQPYAQQNTVYYHSLPKTYTNALYKTQNSTIYPQSRIINPNNSNYNFISPPQPPSYSPYWAKY